MVTPKKEPWQSRIVGHGEEDPSQLLANPANWRIHPKAQQDALAGLLDQVGWVQDVIVNQRTDHVVDGHLRVSLAISRQEPTVPVVYVDLSEDEERLVLASIDPLAAMAVMDKDALGELLASVEAGDAALAAMLAGLGATETVGEGLTDADEIPEEVEPRAKRGDVWLLGEHRVMCGDSTSTEDVARLMNGERAAMVFTDPPWNVDYTGGTKVREALANDNIESGWAEWLTDALRSCVTVQDAPAYVFFGLMRAGDTQMGIEAAGWRIVQTLVWVKQHAQFGNFRAHYKYQHEPLYYCSTGAKFPVWLGPNNEVSVWQHDRAAKNEYHPTQKPVDVAAHGLKNSSAQGALVYDPFLGSGTTLIAAEQLERRCYGLEIEPKYVDVIIARWEAFTGKTAVLDGR